MDYLHRFENILKGMLAFIMRFSPGKSRASSTFLQFNHRLINIHLFVLTHWRLFQFIQATKCTLLISPSLLQENPKIKVLFH